MVRFVVTRRIAAPVNVVFQTVAEIEQFSQAIPRIKRYEFLSESRSGVGTRFRETRSMNGKDRATELEVTEYVENQLHVRAAASERAGT